MRAKRAVSRELPSLLLLCLCLVPAAVSCSGSVEEPVGYTESIEQFRSDRLERLTSERGWLSLVALEWMEEGRNAFGSGVENRIRLPLGMAPEHGGTLLLENGVVSLEPADRSSLLLNDEPAVATRLETDAGGKPDILRIDDLTFYVIERGGRFGVRAKHPESATRTSFRGLEYFPTDAGYRVVGEFVPYRDPRKIEVPTVLGTVEEMLAPGIVRFTLAGETVELVPVVETIDDENYFFIFSDGTSGKETYPSGRFLYSDRERDGEVVLDFNRAVNPPCAFTPFATCPMPPRENRIRIRIEAGEKRYGNGHPEER